MKDEIKEILDYFQKDVDKYEESKKYLMQKYGYDEKKIDNISQHERHINTKKLLDYITNLQEKYEEADNDRHKLFEQKEKAIEYIKNDLILTDGFMIYEDGAKELLDILQGEDKDVKN